MLPSIEVTSEMQTSLILQLTVIVGVFLLAVILIGGYIHVRIKTLNSDKTESIKDLAYLFQKGQFLRLATLILIVVGVVYLAVLYGEDTPKEVIALFSALAGFVLGGLRDERSDPSKPAIGTPNLSSHAIAKGVPNDSEPIIPTEPAPKA